MKKKNSSILNTIVFLCLSFSAGAVAAPHPTVNVYVRVTTPEGHPPTGIRLRPLVTAINGSFSVLEPLLLEDGKFYNELAFNDYWLDWTGPDGISQEYSLELKAASHWGSELVEKLRINKVKVQVGKHTGLKLRLKSDLRKECVLEKRVRSGMTLRLECVLF